MRQPSIFSARFWAVTLGMVLGALSTVAVGPGAAMGGGCGSVCSGVSMEEDCPAEGAMADELCRPQGERCRSADYCDMGLCYGQLDNYWLIACTDEPE